ncbi:PREDICTED: protein piccolo [Ceratotherium simum simum]|uniref:Protein piccolo n=1 Tax=Ceratotherium simum simum TaxID=73337 RepID=A0ABM1CVX6_CERSS|nr:PREDICTED: protein piccolo [Ceratotherium simum simum]
MGNEASLEGEGLPEGLAAAAAAAAGGGAGGAGSPLHTVIPAGMEADLSQLSEEERRQIAAVMSRAQGLPKESVPPAAAEPSSMHRKQELDSSHPPKQPGKPPDPGRPAQPGLSKSRTTDTLRSEQKLPGRSPSTISLKESKSRTDFKEEHKSSMMPGFLSEVNPLSAVSSVVNKFNPFDLISDSDASQEDTAKKQKIAQKEQGKPEGIVKPLSQQSPKPVPKQQGPVRAPLQQDGSPKSVSSQQPEKTKSQPPGTGKPIQGITQAPQTDQAKLPLQRGAARPQSKQSDAVRGESLKPSVQSPSKPTVQQASPGKPPAQQPGPEKLSTAQPGPAKPSPPQPTAKPPAQPPGTTKPTALQPGPQSPAQPPGPAKPQAQQVGSEKPPSQPPGPAKTAAQPPGPAKTPAQPPGPAKTPAQQVGPAKPLAQQPGQGKTPAQQPGPAKPPPQQPGPVKPPPQQPGPGKTPAQQPGPAKPPPQQPGPGKTPTQQPGPAKPPLQQPGPGKTPAQQPGPAKPPPQQPGPGKTPAQQPGPAKPPPQQPGPAKPPPQQPGPAKLSAQQSAKSVSQTGGGKPLQPLTSPSAAQAPVQGLPKTICPLCNTTELLLHVLEKANFNTCTECQTTVCSLCGFNPNPHLTEIKEWLCLNCQMQRALGGDLAPIPSSPQPKPKTAPAIPASAVSKPSPQSQQISPKKDAAPKQDISKAPESKKPLPLVKQPTLHGSPPVTAQQSPVAESPSKPAPPKEPSVPSEQAKVPTADDKPRLPKTVKPAIDTVSSSSTETKPDIPSSRVESQDQEKTIPPLKTDSAKSSQSFPPTGEKVTPFDSRVIPRPASDSKIISHPGPSSESKGQKQVDSVQKREEPKKAQTKISPKPDARPTPKRSPTPPGPRPTTGQTAAASPQPPKPQEQSRRFSLNLGSITDAPKSQPTTPQETVTGKLFGFGASIFSQASNLISTAGQPGSHPQSGPGASTRQGPPPSQPPPSPGPPKPAGQVPPAPAKVIPVKKETKALVAEKLEPKAEQVPTVKRTEMEKKPLPIKDSKPSTAEPQKAVLPPKPEKIPKPESACPLCKTELNIGSKDPPNFNTCTECKNQVCNLCGFNPTPHLTEIQEWLCLNCQTQRAISGQLGDVGKMPPTQSGPKASPVPVPTEQPSQKTALPAQVKVKKKEQEVKTEAEKITPEKVQETPSIEKIPLRVTTDQKQEESKLEKDKTSAPQEKKPSPEDKKPLPEEEKPTTEEKKPGPEGKKPTPKDRKPIPEDKKLPPGAKTSALEEEQKPDLLKTQVQIAEEKPERRVAPQAVQEKKPPQTKMEDLPSGTPPSRPKEDDEMTHKVKERPQAACTAKPDPVEPGKEKTEKEDDKSDASSSQQPKSPQGLSDTGYSSDGISSSLGEIPSLIPTDEKDLLKGLKKDSFSQESSPSSPSDLAKLESTVLSILEAQARTLVEEKSEKETVPHEVSPEQPKEQQKTQSLSETLETTISEEELKVSQEEKDTFKKESQQDVLSRKDHEEKSEFVDDITTRRQPYDSVEDSSESENSPIPQRKRRTSVGSSSSDEYKQEDSQGSGEEEDFIRKQIIEMSADEDASGSEDDEFIRNQLKEISSSIESQRKEETKGKGKVTPGRHRRLTRKSSASFDDDAGRRHSWHDEDDETFDESPELKYRETKSQESEELVVAGGGGLRRFKTIELNSTIADKYSAESSQKKTALYFDEEPELEMESLTDSPEDRSRGEGSSSLHASSFTPGTSPTSVSSLDEDSDSSPSHKKGESKQQRKARHRSHGPLLPTIEDSSEEEELREEEELLKEQEKQRELEQQQRKSSTKKSKKDKDELRAQRRRERPKTPPSNLSPIEDASPTEELRQAAEMEELHRSSCSEYSPSIESDPEGFEISPEKIIEVQKVYKLPTAVSLYSPTDEQSIMQKEGSQKALKSAEEMYEEMMHKPHKYKAFPAANEQDEMFEKEPLYGGMLIEDYIYESLVEDTYNGSVDGSLLTRQEDENGFMQQRGREQKIRLPEQIYEDPMQKITDLQKEFYELESLHSVLPQEDIVSSSYIIPESHEIVDLGSMVTSTSEEKTLLDADAAYEELMKRQQMQLTPGSSPTQPPIRDDMTESTTDFDRVPDASLTSSVLSGASLTDSTSSATLSIPDVKITQHFSAEEIDDEYVTDYTREIQEIIAHESQILTYSEPSESVPPSDTPSLTSSVSSVCTTDSSSPVTTLDSITTVYTEPVDIVTKFEDSEEISSSTYFPGSIIDYPEEISISLDRTTIPDGRTSADHIVISLSDTEPSVIESAGIKPEGLIADAISTDLSVPEKDPGKKAKKETENGMILEVLEAYRDERKESEAELTKISLSETVFDQPPSSIIALPMKEQVSTTCFISGEGFGQAKPASHLPSGGPSVPSLPTKTRPFFRSSSLDTSAQPPPPPPPPPTSPKPTVHPKRKLTVIAPVTLTTTATPLVDAVTTVETTAVPRSIGLPVTKICTTAPPPVPPKPSSIPSGLVFTHRPEPSKPPIAPKPAVPQLPVTTQKPTDTHPKPTGLSLTSNMTLNLVTSADYRLPSPTSPLSPHSNKSSPRFSKSLTETYVVITLPSEPGTPTDSSSSQAITSWPLGLPPKDLISIESVFSVIPPMTAAEISTSSDQSLYISGTLETFSAIPITTLSSFQAVPTSVTQFITTEVSKVEVSAARSPVSSVGLSSISVSIPPEPLALDNLHLEKHQHKDNGKLQLVGDAIDLRTVPKVEIKVTEKCMDLSASTMDMKRQTTINEVYGRQISAVQPSIINLSATSSVVTPITLVTETVTVVTCTASASYTMGTESLVGIEHATTAPLQLTTSKHAEPPYRIPSGQAFPTVREEAPINLSLGTSAHAMTLAITKPVAAPPVGVTNGWTDSTTSQGITDGEAVDLSTTKSHRTVVTMDESTSGVVTKIIEDDEKPVDLTAGRRAVCCDVVYKLPFGRSCTAQQPATTLPEDRFGYRDDHYQYDRSGSYGYRGIGGMKSSMSDTNLAEAGHFFYKSKNAFDYSGGTAAAVDLTSGRITTGEVMDYSSKTTGPYPETRQVISGVGISTPQYSTARMTPPPGSQYGVGSVLRSSNGVVYSSVATPIPSTFAITTQPGSIFSTSVRDLSGVHTTDSVTSLSALHQSQPMPRSYFLTTGASETDIAVTGIDISASLQTITMETLTAETIDSVPTLTTASEVFSEVVGDDSAILIVPEEDKQQQQLDLERELLELEKIKQQRFAEELEWERQEIQRFREQEKIMVQKKLEELQSMKQHLLYQQEEERQAQFMMRQETLAQQQLQLEQIQQLQQQLHQQLEEQKIRQIYQYNYDPAGTASPQTTTEQAILEGQYAAPEGSQFWATEDTTTTASAVVAIEIPQSQGWYTVQSDGVTQYIAPPGILSTVSEIPLADVVVKDEKQPKKRSSGAKVRGQYDEMGENMADDPRCFKKIMDSGVQTDDEDAADRSYVSRRRRTKKSVDTSVQTDDEDQDEWDMPTRSRRKARVGKYGDSTTEADKTKPLSKVSSIAVQTVAEISVQTEPVGTIRTPSIRARTDAKVEIIKHISAPEKTYKGGSLGCQTEADSDTQSPQYLSATSPPKDKKRPTPLEIGYSTHLRADSTLQLAPSPPKSPKVLYSPISPLSPGKALESAFVPYEKPLPDDISPQKVLHPDMAKVPPASPKTAKMMQRSMSDPKPLSPTADESSRAPFQYTEGYTTKSSQTMTPSGTQKKVKRTLPNPPPEETSAGTQPTYSTMGTVSRRRICRTNTMARAKILQDIDRELDLVERESAKLRKKQAELDEEEKEIDAKLRYLEMGINRRKEALLKEREKRERAYLQGVAEDRDYMSDSEVSSARPTRIESQHGIERPRTAPQPEFSQFIPPQTQTESQLVPPTSPYTQYQYSSPPPPTEAPTPYTQQSHFQQQTLYHQQVSPYQTQPTFQAVATMSFTPQAQPTPTPEPSYQLPSQMMVIQQKPRQTTLYLEPKITSNYEVIRNQPLMIAPVSTDNTYAVSHLGSKYNSLDLRIGLEERSSMASSPISSISADSFYADIDHHTPRNYVLIDDIGEITKGTAALSTAFSLHEKDLSKTDHLLRTTETRRSQEVTDFLAPLQTSSRLHSYVKAEEDPMEDPYEIKLLKHQIKQEFRRGAESLDHLAGLSHYYHADTSYRHFPKSEKYSISRLTLEKQAAKQLPAAILYQKQSKHKKSLIDPKMSKFSPIQESRDLEPDYSSYMTSSTSSIGGISTRARLLQDDITFGLRKNITDQQKFMGSSLGSGLGTLGNTIRSALQDEADKPYSSGSRSRPSSRPSSVYGLDLSIKRDSSSSSLRLKAQEAEALDVSFSQASSSGRTKPTSLPISQSRGRIPIVAQNSEEESPLSPVGQPMGMARAAAGPLPPISADTRDQFGSSHSLPEVQQHMREESRTRGYDRDIAFIMDDFQHAMSDSEAYHLRREETDWFDKPRDSRLENGHGLDRKLPERLVHSRPHSQHQEQIIQMNGKSVHYIFPHARIKITRDSKDHTVSGNGLGIRIVGGKEIPGHSGEIGAYIAKILPGGSAEQTGKLMEGMQVLEWNGIPLTSKTYEEVQSIISQQSGEAEICVRLDLNMLSDSENPQCLELHEPPKAVDKAKSPGVDPKQLAAELQKVSLQQSPLVLSSVVEKGSHVHSGPTSAGSSSVPSPGQPGSPSVSKKKHSSSKPTDATKVVSHPITGEIQLQINYDLGNLIIHILQARNLVPRDNNGYSDPFVKVYLLPGRGAEYKRRTKYVQKSLNPEWNQTVIYKSISMEQLKKKTLEVTVWDYDRFSSNDFLGEVLIDLSSTSHLDNTPRWYPLKEQTESIDHGKSHSSQSSQQSPKPSVIKSRSHGIFPDPSKDMQVPTIEKSHSSPGSSKSSSEGHLRSHGPSRSQSKTSVTQTHLEDAGAAIAAAEAAVQQLRLQPTKPTNQRPAESSVSTGSSGSSFGSGYSVDSEGSSSTAGETNLFLIPRIGKMGQNGQEPVKQPGAGVGLADPEVKTQVMGEIKIALKKEMKTDGEQLIVEILQCRNITYKFKSPDHLPDLYVKIYVMNVSTQKKVIKKKTRVCRHDREPSFNETFRFSLSPAGHSLQILLFSNGGKFMKKTLIGEACIWLDKVDLRKRIVNWHKLLVSPTQTH